jgi:hypothetical protein
LLVSLLMASSASSGATLMSCWCDVVGSVVAFLSDCQQVPIPVNVLVAAEQDRIKQERRNTHCATLPTILKRDCINPTLLFHPEPRRASKIYPTYSSIPPGNASRFPLRARLRIVNASRFSHAELNWSLKSLLTFDLVSSWIPPRYTMADHAHLQIRHAWSFISENDIALNLEKLGLTLNHPESALICSRCKYALQSSGVGVSRHLAERHNVPASDRTELVTCIDSLRLLNPGSATINFLIDEGTLTA